MEKGAICESVSAAVECDRVCVCDLVALAQREPLWVVAPPLTFDPGGLLHL